MLCQVLLHAVDIERPEASDAAGGDPILHTCAQECALLAEPCAFPAKHQWLSVAWAPDPIGVGSQSLRLGTWKSTGAKAPLACHISRV